MTFVGHVRQTLASTSDKTTNWYALKSFIVSMQDLGSDDVTPGALTHWIANLFLKGNSAATVKRYLCRLHVAYTDWMGRDEVQGADDDPFDSLLSLAVKDNEIRPDEPRDNLKLIHKLITPDTYRGEIGKWKAVFFYLLYNPAATLEDAVDATFDTAPRFCPQTAEIVESMDSSHGRRYLFPLNQADKRVPGMVRDIVDSVGSVTRATGMTYGDGFSRESITAMWVCAALRAGIPAGEIRAVIGTVPAEYRILDRVTPARLTDLERQDIVCRVANRINDNTTRWYVVNMRDKVTPDDVRDTVKENIPAMHDRITFFYPTHRVWRENRRKKRVEVEVPFIPGLLFLKVRSDMVSRVMGGIREVAWGYRYSKTPDSPYSVISQRAMTDFQRHIGEYTDDIRMEIVAERPHLETGDQVTLRGDSVEGAVGEIVEIKERKGVRTYSVRLTQDTAFHWTVTIADELRLEPIR